MSLMIATVEIRGIRPLLMNCFTLDAIPLERKAKKGVAGNNPEEWKNTYFATQEGQLYVDSSYVFSCLREAAKHTKHGGKSIQSDLSSTLQILDDKILFNRYMPKNIDDLYESTPEDDVYLDIRAVKRPNSTAKNIRYRVALATGWETKFKIQWDNTIISSPEMQQVLRDAGAFTGLADGRKIGFGRFEIVSYKETEVKKNAKKASSY